jgi:ribonuclease E
MTTQLLINATAANELRVATVEDGELIELDIEAADQSTIKGNVYKGIVQNVEGALEAAFVNIGLAKQGFLPFSEVSDAHYPKKSNGDRRPKITEVLRRGQEILVQVAKDAIGEKGATLTTHLSLAGRYSVLMPGTDANGISRKIEDDKIRKRIRAMAQKLVRPEGCGFIVRTAGLGQTRLAIQRDLDRLVALYEKTLKAGEMARAPSVIYAEPDVIVRTLRDFFTDEIDEVWIDQRDEYASAMEYFQDLMPEYADRLKSYENPIPIFAYHHVEEQIEATFERVVALPSGGSIVIDETEALVAIDVNSGRMTSEKAHEDTVFKTNCEAAEEAARQLKLRDLGGIVVIDFIDMEQSKNRREVERILAEAAREDRARYKISRINSKGLLVLTRQRIRQGMRKAFQRRCAVCAGVGWVRTAEAHSLSLLRRVETRLGQGGVGEVRVDTHRETAEYLLNYKRTELSKLENAYHCRIVIRAKPEMERANDEVVFLSRGEVLAEITDRLPPRPDLKDRANRRRKKRRAKRTEPVAEDDQIFETDEPSSLPSRSRKRGKKDRPREVAPVEDRPQLEAKGDTTFTGRPSPAMLAKLKAERQQRMAQRRNGGAEAGGAQMGGSGDDGYAPADGGANGLERAVEESIATSPDVAEVSSQRGLSHPDSPTDDLVVVPTMLSPEPDVDTDALPTPVPPRRRSRAAARASVTKPAEDGSEGL